MKTLQQESIISQTLFSSKQISIICKLRSTDNQTTWSRSTKKKKIVDKSRSKNYWNWKYTKARRIRRRWNCVYWQCQRSLSDPKSKRTPSIRHFLRLRSPSYNKRSSERVLKSIDWTPLSSMQIRIKKKCFDTFYSAFCGNIWRWELEGERDKHGTRTWP